MKNNAFTKKFIKETGLDDDDFFMNGFDELDDDTETEEDEFDEDTEDEILEEMLGLDSDYTLEDYLDSYDP